MHNVTHVSQETFGRDVLQAELPVLVDFYADWCGPCRMFAPTIERIALEFADRAKVVKVDIDAEPELAAEFQVDSIPTLAFFAGGKFLGKAAGLTPEASLRRTLDQLVNRVAATTRHLG